MSKDKKVQRIGNSLGEGLSKKHTAKMSVEKGDALTHHDPDFDQALEAARDFMRHHPNAMKKLAGWLERNCRPAGR